MSKNYRFPVEVINSLGSILGGQVTRQSFFSVVPGNRYTIVAIHDSRPFLPWYFYVATQAVVHKLVMKAYQRHLARLADE